MGLGSTGSRVWGNGVLPEKTLPHRAEGLPGREGHPKKGVHGWCLLLPPAQPPLHQRNRCPCTHPVSPEGTEPPSNQRTCDGGSVGTPFLSHLGEMGGVLVPSPCLFSRPIFQPALDPVCRMVTAFPLPLPSPDRAPPARK